MYTFNELKDKVDFIYDNFSVKVYLAEKIKKRVSYIYGKGNGFKYSPMKVYDDERYVIFVEADLRLYKKIKESL